MMVILTEAWPEPSTRLGNSKAGSSLHDDCEGCDDCLCGGCGEQIGVNAKCECRD